MPNDFVSPNDLDFLLQLVAMDTNLAAYSSALELKPEQLASITADKNYFGYVTGNVGIIRNANTQWTSWRDIVRDGGDFSMTTEAPVPIFLPSPPPVRPGIEARFRSIAKIIKAHTNYNDAIGRALGIVRDAPSAPDLALVKPVIYAKVDGDDVRITWNWGGNAAFLDQCEIHVHRNDGKGFVLLTIDTTPNYVDTYPRGEAPAQWIYRAIYRVGDRQVGLWSDPTGVLVGGA